MLPFEATGFAPDCSCVDFASFEGCVGIFCPLETEVGRERELDLLIALEAPECSGIFDFIPCFDPEIEGLL